VPPCLTNTKYYSNLITIHSKFTDALSAYKLKKQYEEEIIKIQAMKMTLETQRIQLESASQTAMVVDALNTGKNVIRNHQSENGIDKVESLMDEIQDQTGVSNEINQALTQSVDLLLASDEDLLAELEAIVAEELEKDLLKAVPTPEQVELHMPSLPESRLLAVVNDPTHRTEEVYQQLEAEKSRL
jgi:charged multivesicular body protein 4